MEVMPDRKVRAQPCDEVATRQARRGEVMPRPTRAHDWPASALFDVALDQLRHRSLRAADASAGPQGNLRLVQDMPDFCCQGRLGQGLLQHRHAHIEPATMHDGIS